MPSVRKLTPDEVRTIEGRVKGQRKLIEEEYDGILQEYNEGEYGEAELGADENRITVRNRLKAAASRRDLGLDFKRTKGNVLRFRVVAKGEEGDDESEEAEETASVAVGSSEAPDVPKGRGRGRRKAQVS